MTPAQIEFWSFLEQFNRPPDDATDLQLRIFATRGEAPAFAYLRTSTNSVFGDMEGVLNHRAAFIERYPWVRKLVETYNLTLSVDESLFRGDARAVLENYARRYRWDREDGFGMATPNRVVFTGQWLSCLLVADYIFACGSMEDRRHGLIFLEHVFNAPGSRSTMDQQRKQHGGDLEIPACRDIAMAVMDDFPEYVSDPLLRSVYDILKTCDQPDVLVDYFKWLLRIEAFRKHERLVDLVWVLAGNTYVQYELLHYAVYWRHLKTARPEKGSMNSTLSILFKRLYGTQQQAIRRQYSSLLKQAYP